MADLNVVSQKTFDDVPASFDLPEGEYLVQVSRAAVKVDDEDREYFEMRLKALEALGDVALPGEVEDAFPVQDKVWLHTKGAKKWALDIVKRILQTDDISGLSYATVAEAMIGQQVRVVITQTHKEGRDRPYVNVERYLKAA